jgi:hypothetical protein
VLDQAFLNVLLIGLNGFGVVVSTLALFVAGTAIRRQSRTALIAVAVYGACLLGHVVAILVLLAN